MTPGSRFPPMRISADVVEAVDRSDGLVIDVSIRERGEVSVVSEEAEQGQAGSSTRESHEV